MTRLLFLLSSALLSPAIAMAQGSPVVLKGHEDEVHDASFSADGKFIVSGDERGVCQVRDLASRKIIARFKADTKTRRSEVRATLFFPDGKTVAAATTSGSVGTWHFKTGKPIRTFAEPSRRGGSEVLAVSPDGKRLAACSRYEILMWNTETGGSLGVLKGHRGEIRFLEFTENGKRLISAATDGTIRTWDPEKKKEILSVTVHPKYLVGGASSLDGSLFASIHDDGVIKLWSGKDGTALKTLSGPPGRLRSIAVGPKGKRIATGDNSGTLRVWDGTTGKELWKSTGRWGKLNRVRFGRKGKRVAASCEDGSIRLWSLK